MEQQLFDRQAVLSSADAIGHEPIKRVLIIFSETCVEECAQIRANLEGGNIAEVRRLAHGIAGAAGNCSAIKLQEIARRIEHSENPDPEQIIVLQSVAESSASWVRNELPDLLKP